MSTPQTDMHQDLAGLSPNPSSATNANSPISPRRWEEGAFLRQIVDQMQPMLRESMRSRRIVLSSGPRGVVALASDGVFLRLGIGGQEDVLDPVEVIGAASGLPAILDGILAELGAANDAHATTAAAVVRTARRALPSD